MSSTIDLSTFPLGEDVNNDEYVMALENLKALAEQELPDGDVEPTAEDMERYYKHFKHLHRGYLDYGMGRDNEVDDSCPIGYWYDKREKRVEDSLYSALAEQQNLG